MATRITQGLASAGSHSGWRGPRAAPSHVACRPPLGWPGHRVQALGRAYEVLAVACTCPRYPHGFSSALPGVAHEPEAAGSPENGPEMQNLQVPPPSHDPESESLGVGPRHLQPDQLLLAQVGKGPVGLGP